MQKYSESEERGEFEMTQVACGRAGGRSVPSFGTGTVFIYTVNRFCQLQFSSFCSSFQFPLDNRIHKIWGHSNPVFRRSVHARAAKWVVADGFWAVILTEGERESN